MIFRGYGNFLIWQYRQKYSKNGHFCPFPPQILKQTFLWIFSEGYLLIHQWTHRVWQFNENINNSAWVIFNWNFLCWLWTTAYRSRWLDLKAKKESCVFLGKIIRVTNRKQPQAFQFPNHSKRKSRKNRDIRISWLNRKPCLHLHLGHDTTILLMQ